MKALINQVNDVTIERTVQLINKTNQFNTEVLSTLSAYKGNQLIMIKFNNISKTYSKQTVLDVESLEIQPGQAFGLVGNNGAGKTTLFSTLLDLIKPSTGEVLNNDINVRTSEDWKSFTSAFLDDSFLIGYLMPEEYFYFVGELEIFQNK